jgi:predicted aminopeptidase
LSVAPQNQWEEDDAGHAPRSNGLLRLEVSRVMVSQFASKLAETRYRAEHVTSSWRSREDEVEDGCNSVMDCIRLFYSNFIVFIVLGHTGILVFLDGPINRTQGVGA